MDNISGLIDHTLLDPAAPLGRYTEICREATFYKFHSVCVQSGLVPLVAKLLSSNPLNTVNICSTVGFPLGSSLTDAKLLEINHGIKYGAKEFDVVPLICAVKTGDWDHYEKEIQQFRYATQGFILKVILEVALLTDDEVKKCCEICKMHEVDFVKTSTGFSRELKPIETARYVQLMSECVKGSNTKVKASGWIRTLNDFELMLVSGASRIGCSKSVAIMQEFEKANGR